MPNIRPRSSYVPEVGPQFTPQPTLPSNLGAQPFEALKDLGRTITGLGHKGLEKQAQEAEREKNRASQDLYIQTANQDQIELQRLQNTAGPGAPGFTASSAEFFNRRHSQILDTARANGMQPAQLADLTTRLAELRMRITGTSLGFEDQQHKAYEEDAFRDSATTIGQMVLRDPNSLPAALDELRERVNNIPYVDEATREALYENEEARIRLAAGLTVAGADPARVIAALSPATPGAPITSILTFTSRHYTAQDFVSKDEGTLKIASGVVSALDDVMDAFGRTVPINSGYRSPERNAAVGGASDSQHTHGTAVDLNLAGLDGPARQRLLSLLIAKGFKGIGFYTNSPDMLHVDMRGTTTTWVNDGSGNNTLRSGGQFPAWAAGIMGQFRSGVGTQDPVLGTLTADEQLRVLGAAQTQQNQNQTAFRAGLELDVFNAGAAFDAGLDWSGPAITQERFQAAYDPITAGQKWAAYEGAREVGLVKRDIRTLPMGEIQSRVDELRPTDFSSPTIGEERKAYAAAVQAMEDTRQDRSEDPVGYALRNFTPLQVAAHNLQIAPAADLSRARQLYYSQLSAAFDQMDIAQSDRRAFTTSGLQGVKDRWAELGPAEQVAELANLAREAGPDMFRIALTQLGREGLYKEAYIADLANRSPYHQGVLADALRGLASIKNEDVPAPSEVAMESLIQGALNAQTLTALPSGQAGAIRELAMGLYVARGGTAAGETGRLPTTGEEDKFLQAVRDVIGGAVGLSTGGWMERNGGMAQFQTILPANVSADQFNKVIDAATDPFYQQWGNGTPHWGTGGVATAAQIAYSGVFVRVGSGDEYMIHMEEDGNPLKTASGDDYLIRLPQNERMWESGTSAPEVIPPVTAGMTIIPQGIHQQSDPAAQSISETNNNTALVFQNSLAAWVKDNAAALTTTGPFASIWDIMAAPRPVRTDAPEPVLSESNPRSITDDETDPSAVGLQPETLLDGVMEAFTEALDTWTIEHAGELALNGPMGTMADLAQGNNAALNNGAFTMFLQSLGEFTEEHKTELRGATTSEEVAKIFGAAEFDSYFTAVNPLTGQVPAPWTDLTDQQRYVVKTAQDLFRATLNGQSGWDHMAAVENMEKYGVPNAANWLLPDQISPRTYSAGPTDPFSVEGLFNNPIPPEEQSEIERALRLRYESEKTPGDSAFLFERDVIKLTNAMAQATPGDDLAANMRQDYFPNPTTTPAAFTEVYTGMVKGVMASVVETFARRWGGDVIDSRLTPWLTGIVNAVRVADGTVAARAFTQFGRETTALHKGNIVVGGGRTLATGVGFLVREVDEGLLVQGKDSVRLVPHEEVTAIRAPIQVAMNMEGIAKSENIVDIRPGFRTPEAVFDHYSAVMGGSDVLLSAIAREIADARASGANVADFDQMTPEMKIRTVNVAVQNWYNFERQGAPRRLPGPTESAPVPGPAPGPAPVPVPPPRPRTPVPVPPARPRT